MDNELGCMMKKQSKQRYVERNCGKRLSELYILRGCWGQL